MRIGENLGDWVALEMRGVAETMEEVDDSHSVGDFPHILAALVWGNSHV